MRLKSLVKKNETDRSGAAVTNLVALPKGTELGGDYRLQRVLGAGGFGITYLAEEVPLARLVTIKEFFPVDFAARNSAEEVCPRSQGSVEDYKWGLERFIEEAQTLARFTHPNIVRVYRYFRSHNTGYIVLHFEEGASLKGWLKDLGRAPRQQELDRIVGPLLDALEQVHAADYLHRDIAPDNIMIRRDGTPVLIDFGSARGDIARHSKTLSALVKPGYSPYEQYGSKGTNQGPWTDIYSLAATLYHAVTGKRPPDAPSRMVADEIVPVRDAALSSYRPGFLAAIDHGLALDLNARPRSIAAWRAELLAPAPASGGRAKAPARDIPPPSPLGAAAAPAPIAAAAIAAPTVASASAVADAAASAAVGSSPATPGVIGAFLQGWRSGSGEVGGQQPAGPAAVASAANELPLSPPSVKHEPVEPPPPPAPMTSAKPASKSAAKSVAKSPGKSSAQSVSKPAPAAVAAVAESPSRRATPRAIRSPRWRWRPLVAKLAVGGAVAAAAVAWQERQPSPAQTQGSGTVLSQTGDAVPVGQLKGHSGPVTSIGFGNDGRSIVSTGADATIKVWNANNRALVRSIDIEHGAAAGMAVLGRRAVTGHKDGTVALWDLETGAKIARLKRNDAAVWSVAFAGEADRVLAASHDGAVTMWDIRNPTQPAGLLEGHQNAAQAVAYSSNGLIASGSADKSVKLWRADSSVLVRTYQGHADYVTAVAFAPDGRKLASAGLDGAVRIWSTASSRLHYGLSGHQGRVAALAFSPDGEMLASASEDGSVRVWSLRQGRTLRTLKSHTGELKAVSFAPDGRRIAAAGNDGLVRLYNATTGKPGT